MTFVSRSPEETEAFGARVGATLARGAVLGLSGDLGAGKTAFVRGLARGLGFAGRVHSPTFALFHHYRGGRLDLFHLDLYRLNSPDDVRGAGLEEYLLRPEGVTIAEWIERWTEPGAQQRLHFRVLDENAREISHDLPGV
jgi:tRNA threonylcarbamoyladenosine biosynthesis protein TsaE